MGTIECMYIISNVGIFMICQLCLSYEWMITRNEHFAKVIHPKLYKKDAKHCVWFVLFWPQKLYLKAKTEFLVQMPQCNVEKLKKGVLSKTTIFVQKEKKGFIAIGIYDCAFCPINFFWHPKKTLMVTPNRSRQFCLDADKLGIDSLSLW